MRTPLAHAGTLGFTIGYIATNMPSEIQGSPSRPHATVAPAGELWINRNSLK
jgi:hypothetical protein